MPAHTYVRASRDLEEYRTSVTRETDEQIRPFRDLAGVVLDLEIRKQEELQRDQDRGELNLD